MTQLHPDPVESTVDSVTLLRMIYCAAEEIEAMAQDAGMLAIESQAATTRHLAATLLNQMGKAPREMPHDTVVELMRKDALKEA